MEIQNAKNLDARWKKQEDSAHTNCFYLFVAGP
jgi:hypothetical protein